MTAHRAKDLEFDHVLILDGGRWSGRGDDERRLYYVAMTRARKTLTLCETIGGQPPFVGELNGAVLRSRPAAQAPEPGAAHRTWCADQGMIVLSWPGRFVPTAPIHRPLAALDVGSPLILRPRGNNGAGWELADESGDAVGRMLSKFQPPEAKIVAVRVAAMLVRYAKEGEPEGMRSQSWELVLPEIECVPG